MNTLRAVVLDDEPLAVDWMRHQLGRIPQVQLTGTFEQFTDLHQHWHELLPDVLFLDMEMPVRHGLDVAEWARKLPVPPEIVYVTAHAQFALQAFRVKAADYLLKPVGIEELQETVQMLWKRRFSVPTVSQTTRLPEIIDQQSDRPVFRIFGVSGLWMPGQSTPMRWPTAKTEEVFHYLVLNSHRLTSKWVLLDRLFPPPIDDKTVNLLHKTISRVKKTLQEQQIKFEWIADPNGYRLILSGAASELNVLEQWHRYVVKENQLHSKGQPDGRLQTFSDWLSESHDRDAFELRDWEWITEHRYAVNRQKEELAMRML